MDKENQQQPEYELDLDKVEKARIIDMRQEGNFIIVTTDKGIKFRQRIPNNKVLTKINGEYSLQDMQVREVAQQS